MLGELVPIGGGDPIPLLKRTLLVGRRESCDIILRFDNVSAHHCQLVVHGGYWYVKDLNSRNGVKVNNTRIVEKRLDPGDVLYVSNHRYEVKYFPIELGAVGPPPPDTVPADIFGKSLLERAGLVSDKSKGKTSGDTPPPSTSHRPDLLDDVDDTVPMPVLKPLAVDGPEQDRGEDE
jgi:predicted component of type VI protein secretion system